MTTFSLPAMEDKSGFVRRMFARIAPVYDLLNHSLSMGIDILWRRAAARALDIRSGQEVLDVCCGTGDLAFDVARQGAGRVVGLDFCEPMVVRAHAKSARRGLPTRFMVGDGLDLPFRDARFDRTCVAFGIRNVSDPSRGLKEMTRVLRPEGRLVVLEFSRPISPGLRTLYDFYFRKILPLIGKIVSGDPEAYTYLPESVMQFPIREPFVDLMRGAGLSDCGYRDLTLGIATLYWGNKGDSPQEAGGGGRGAGGGRN